jgi:hypothetical protein
VCEEKNPAITSIIAENTLSRTSRNFNRTTYCTLESGWFPEISRRRIPPHRKHQNKEQLVWKRSQLTTKYTAKPTMKFLVALFGLTSLQSLAVAASLPNVGGQKEQHVPYGLYQAISRSLQPVDDSEIYIPPCNSLLATLTADELRVRSQGLVDSIATDPESFEYTYLQSILVNPIQYGIQVHRLCAGCEDVSVAEEAEEVFDTFCGPDNYGATNATFTGLMMVPVMNDTTVLEGTLKGIIDMHPTSTVLVPSILWPTTPQNPGEDTIPVDEEEVGQEVFLLQLDSVLAATGQVMVFPDYMGYAENAEELYKGYTIKKAYETSSVPIVLWAQDYLRDITDCATAMSNTVGVKGYSEGGYTALVLADVLYRMGWDVVNVHAGGGPYNLTAATTRTYELIANGEYDMGFRHILALVGSSYSSTYRDLPNYESQDMLRDEIRPTIVNIITNSTSEPIVREFMPYEQQSDVLDLLFNEDYVDFINASVSIGILDPCASLSEEELMELNVDLICEAFRLNDVSNMLQTVPYPVEVCHSPADKIVPIESVPDLSGNSNITFTEVEGNHNDAGGACIFNGLVYFLSPAWQELTVEPLHSTLGCDALLDEPELEDSPSLEPSPEPMGTNEPTIAATTSNPTQDNTTNPPSEPPSDSAISALGTWMTSFFLATTIASLIIV